MNPRMGSPRTRKRPWDLVNLLARRFLVLQRIAEAPLLHSVRLGAIPSIDVATQPYGTPSTGASGMLETLRN